MVPPKLRRELNQFLDILQSRWGQDLVSMVLFGVKPFYLGILTAHHMGGGWVRLRP